MAKWVRLTAQEGHEVYVNSDLVRRIEAVTRPTPGTKLIFSGEEKYNLLFVKEQLDVVAIAFTRT